MGIEISNADFIGSFLKAARERKMSVVVLYGETVGTRSRLKLTSNVGPETAVALVREVARSPSSADNESPPAADA